MSMATRIFRPEVTTAGSRLEAALQRILINLIDLGLQAKQAHWVSSGPGFRVLHDQLDEIADFAHESADLIAERIQIVGGTADGRLEAVALGTELAYFPASAQTTPTAGRIMRTRLRQMVGVLRDERPVIDEADSTTAGMVDGIIERLEKELWLLRAELAC